MVSSAPLGEVCDFIRGVAFDGSEAIDLPKEGYVPILRAGNIGDELYIRDDLVWVPEKRVSKEQLFQVGDIAICMASGSPAVLGKTAQLKENFMGSVGAFCGIIRPTKADPNYIAYWLKSPTFMAWRDSQANGVNIQNLRPNEVREIEIPLPPLTEQKRIASLLARADRLRHLRRTAHDLGDSLLQSVFLEMFGDPQFNGKKWDLVTLGEKITFMTSGSRGWAEHYSDKGDLFLRIQNVGANQLLLDDVAYVQAPDTVESKRTRVQPGDLLISATADLGRTAVIPENFPTAYINQHLFLLRLKDLNPVFIAGYYSTQTGKAQILRLDREGVKSGLNFDDVKSLTVFNPPLSLQEEFAGVVARVESLRGRMSEGERQVEGLFESLLTESFGG